MTARTNARHTPPRWPSLEIFRQPGSLKERADILGGHPAEHHRVLRSVPDEAESVVPTALIVLELDQPPAIPARASEARSGERPKPTPGAPHSFLLIRLPIHDEGWSGVALSQCLAGTRRPAHRHEGCGAHRHVDVPALLHAAHEGDWTLHGREPPQFQWSWLSRRASEERVLGRQDVSGLERGVLQEQDLRAELPVHAVAVVPHVEPGPDPGEARGLRAEVRRAPDQGEVAGRLQGAQHMLEHDVGVLLCLLGILEQDARSPFLAAGLQVLDILLVVALGIVGFNLQSRTWHRHPQRTPGGEEPCRHDPPTAEDSADPRPSAQLLRLQAGQLRRSATGPTGVQDAAHDTWPILQQRDAEQRHERLHEAAIPERDEADHVCKNAPLSDADQDQESPRKGWSQHVVALERCPLLQGTVETLRREVWPLLDPVLRCIPVLAAQVSPGSLLAERRADRPAQGAEPSKLGRIVGDAGEHLNKHIWGEQCKHGS
mmetsp:Transcript_44369/g.128369  ORF Transcript_44369/g.128369 Transcript_44369/m.128369 type:complete len:489 (+) Transcript_44369:226-1692(+)